MVNPLITTTKHTPTTNGQVRQLGSIFEKVVSDLGLDKFALQVAMRGDRLRSFQAEAGRLVRHMARPYEETGVSVKIPNSLLDFRVSRHDAFSLCERPSGEWKYRGEVSDFISCGCPMSTEYYTLLKLTVPCTHQDVFTCLWTTLHYEQTTRRELAALIKSGFKFNNIPRKFSVRSIVIVASDECAYDPRSGDQWVPGIHWDTMSEPTEGIVEGNYLSAFRWGEVVQNDYYILVRRSSQHFHSS